jgi:type I restriction enzyme S subunit
MDDRSLTSLDELAGIRHGFAFKGEFFHDDPPGDFLLTPGNFAIGGGFQWGKKKFYRGPVPEDFVLRPGDLIVTMTDLSKEADTLGYPAIIPDSQYRFLHNQRIGRVIIKSDHAHKDFIYWLLRTNDYRNEILAGYTGSTVKHTAPKKILSFKFLLPCLEDQIRIAHVLGTLEGKIDLNRRMNETLEAMARAIFKDWFVDFGPTRAKMEGRPPYLGPEIWSLFPAFLDNEDKPAEWTNGRLLDICELKRGYDLPTANRRPGCFPIVSSSGVSGAHDQSMAKSPGIVTGRYGTVGEVFFLEEDFWPLNTALYVRDFKGNEPRYIYYVLRGIDFGIYSDKGAVPGLNRNHLHQHPVLRVPREVQRVFVATLEPVWTRQRLNACESETLAATRDLLLPKLMSGEIHVRDAERMVEAAA